MSKAMNKAKETVEKLTALESRNQYQAKLLLNAKFKIEQKSLSKLYKEMQALDTSEILGKSKFPTFKEFAAKMPQKELFSMYECLSCLCKFNNAEKQVKRAAKQQAAVDKMN
jgi:uncharacterized protein HemY